MTGLEHLKKNITTSSGKYNYYSLSEYAREKGNIARMPFSIRILLENIIRNFNGNSINQAHLDNVLSWGSGNEQTEIPFLPARVLMQDFTGVPSVVDIASIRSEIARRRKDPKSINPHVPVDLIIDHSVQVDFFGTNYAYENNIDLEYKRNAERYSLLKWAQASFSNFNVLPPGMGICHQVNLEYLATVVAAKSNELFPDTLVGTDSHTPMINGIGVLGWGVGGIEAEAVMLGQPMYIKLPEVIGLKLTGKMREGTTSTDLVLSVANLLRKISVVEKFVEVFGDGLDTLTVPDRATISNMSPEFGSTVTFFPPDNKTLEYLEITGRGPKLIKTVEKYLKANLLWRENEDQIKYSEVIELKLDEIQPSVAGPKRPQDKIALSDLKNNFIEILRKTYEREYISPDERPVGKWSDEGGHLPDRVPEQLQAEQKFESADVDIVTKPKISGLKSVVVRTGNAEYLLGDGSVVIAAITSCTNTSNPSVMIGAGLLAKKAVLMGLTTKPWVKTSLAPGSQVVTEYLKKAGLLPYLEALGYHIVGYGCTTCIGNSGPLPIHIHKAVTESNLVVASVLSGNRNFEARIHPLVKMNFLTSPPLVIAYGLTGRIDINLHEEPISYDPNLEPIFLRDIWPKMEEIDNVMSEVLDSKDFVESYSKIYKGDDRWRELVAPASDVYEWNENSNYIREAPFFRDLPAAPELIESIRSARVLLKLGDSVTTDHISPAGSISENSPSGIYLKNLGISRTDFNSYGSRRGNHEVMIRGTFANVRLRNELSDREGGFTKYFPENTVIPVFDASEKYRRANTPLIILAGKDYGSGSSRDWAAKGVSLLGVKAIIAESFERIHRSNLVGMGVLPLQFIENQAANKPELKGDEIFDIEIPENLKPNQLISVVASSPSGTTKKFNVRSRLDSNTEITYFINGGILQYVVRSILRNEDPSEI
ncbi:MAG TPA: aconitate hydratase AcnA [Bacteroidales bacterium]|nr:aconitate hydratase AcnA [Bacteroidales bacterium]